MKIQHHLDDATLMIHAAGALSSGMALIVDCHLERCPACRRRLHQAEAVGGSLLEAVEPVPLDSADALSRLLGHLDDEPVRPPSSPATTVDRDPEVPRPLALRLQRPLDALDWRMLAPGVSQVDLHRGGPGATRLLRIAPGVSVPHHGHRGNELTLILRGSYADELGRFRVGDVADVDEQVDHQPINDTGEDCICLIATDAPLRFSGWMGRLAQPFIGL